MPANNDPSGFLLVDKPSGMTSFDVVRQLRGILGIKKLGHSGVLDRPAMGLLVIGAGQATRLFELFSGFDKEYEADIWLGLRTATDDLAGEFIPVDPGSDPNALATEAIQQALAAQVGEIDQVPPAFSLTKVAGKELYRYALAGKSPEAAPKRVTVHSIEIVADQPHAAIDSSDLPVDSRLDPAAVAGLPLRRISIRMRCRGGVYVRSIARDAGAALGCGGAVGRLVRTQVGPFNLAEAWSLEDLSKRRADNPSSALLLPLAALAAEERSLVLTPAEVAQIITGKSVTRHRAQLPGLTGDLLGILQRATGEAELVALLAITGDGGDGTVELHPRKVFGQHIRPHYGAAEA
jgi:tRNA pseudouridine55 synthase